MKLSKKIFSILIVGILALQLCTVSYAKSDYTIVSPYKDVIWSGDNAWGAYKGTLHTHTTYSDADDTLAVMIKEYYNQGYDFVANADHGITGVEWNKTPDTQLLYTYQLLIDNPYEHLTDDEYKGITEGTYPLYDGEIRNKKMTCVTGANEFNNLSLTKNHVNGFFLPGNKGSGFPGAENELGFEQAIAFIEKNGGLSHINHPGDWIESNQNPEVVNDPEVIKFYGDLILKYKSCLGTEVLNEKNGTTGYDSILWDNLLMYTLPYGKTVIGFSNNDAHNIKDIDSSYSIFMMKENTVENVKETMQSGAFFGITRKLRGNNFEIGPKEEINLMNSELPVPMFSSLTVDGHTINASTTDAHTVQWIANGKVIAKSAVNAENPSVTLNLDSIEGAEDFQYVRVEAFGEGGLCVSQAMIIDDGSEPLKFEEKQMSLWEKIVHYFRGSKLCAIIDEILRRIG